MRVFVYKDYDSLSRAAAATIAAQIRRVPDAVLGLATGATPIGTYAELVRLHREGRVSFARVTTYNLDEYLGLDPQDRESYHFYMWRFLFGQVDIDPRRVHIPPGRPDDAAAACAAYERAIEAAGGIDLQLLGIGRNGHIGFNEPGSELRSETHVVTLSEDTRRANARFFGGLDRVPRRAITMGVGTIMKARRILLLAAGADKAEAVREAVEGPVTPRVPASALRAHPRVALLLDEAAAACLSRTAEVIEARGGEAIFEELADAVEWGERP